MHPDHFVVSENREILRSGSRGGQRPVERRGLPGCIGNHTFAGVVRSIHGIRWNHRQTIHLQGVLGDRPGINLGTAGIIRHQRSWGDTPQHTSDTRGIIPAPGISGIWQMIRDTLPTTRGK
ncbi:hypothetical protein ASZ90_015520 [hydrocarbon metagenome]|uniref:Uncharacterized protein n=1 Tax=hydrocarbon metagenome TaxID=938273 RepID=A0A0W8F1U2_9ZZZZ